MVSICFHWFPLVSWSPKCPGRHWHRPYPESRICLDSGPLLRCVHRRSELSSSNWRRSSAESWSKWFQNLKTAVCKAMQSYAKLAAFYFVQTSDISGEQIMIPWTHHISSYPVSIGIQSYLALICLHFESFWYQLQGRLLFPKLTSNSTQRWPFSIVNISWVVDLLLHVATQWDGLMPNHSEVLVRCWNSVYLQFLHNLQYHTISMISMISMISCKFN